jgi:hypothetical protein
MHRGGQHLAPLPEDLLRAVAVVGVEIHDRHPLTRRDEGGSGRAQALSRVFTIGSSRGLYVGDQPGKPSANRPTS